MDDLAQEVQLQVKAARAPPPLELQHGYANEENEKRGMAAPKFGTFEVVNKNRHGEIIGASRKATNQAGQVDPSAHTTLTLRMRCPRQVLVAINAEELVVNRRDPNGHATPVYGRPGSESLWAQPGLAGRLSTLQNTPSTLQECTPHPPKHSILQTLHPPGYVGTHLYLLPEQTVMHGAFEEDSSMQQAATRARVAMGGGGEKGDLRRADAARALLVAAGGAVLRV